MLRRFGWGLLAFPCVACGGTSETPDADVGVAEQQVWRGTDTGQANIPYFITQDSIACSMVMLTPRLGLTAQHCDKVLPVTDSSGTKRYVEVTHPGSSLWSGRTNPRITWTWAAPGWVLGERTRDIRIVAFQESEAPPTVFPQRVRYFDSASVYTPTYATGQPYELPVVWMGWGYTENGELLSLHEQRAYTFGNELPTALFPNGDYREWRANLGRVDSYMGPDRGDSGGPFFRQVSTAEPNEYELLGVSSGPDPDENGNDPRINDQVRATLSASEKAIADARIVMYHWPDATQPTFLENLYYLGGDATRPGRLYGERDYYGPVRTDLDADGDYFYGTSGSSCPMYLYDQRGAYGELTQAGGVSYAPNLGTSLPALHAYRSLYLNDRTRVYNSTGGFGTVVLGSHEARLRDNGVIGGRIGTDTVVGKLYAEGGGTLALADRAYVGAAWWQGINMNPGNGVTVVNTPEASTMRLPQSRLAKAFPARTYGTVPNVTRIAVAGYWAGPCTSSTYCHVYQGIEPGNAVTLAPGYYGDLSVKANSTITLSGGDYFFDGLATESGSNLVVAAGASARVWVRDTLTLRNYGNLVRTANPTTGIVSVTDASAAANLLIGYYGLSAVTVWELTGTLIAPYAKVSLETNRSVATAHAGMVIANELEMHQGNSFYQVPYQCR